MARIFEENIKNIAQHITDTVMDDRNIVNLRTPDNIDGVYRFVLRPGKIYAFESAGSDYKVQICTQDGAVQANTKASIGGIILYTPDGYRSKLIAINGKPSLTNLLSMYQSVMFNVDKTKPNIYLEGLDGQTFIVWEIG